MLGDVISFAPHSGRIFQSWPGVEEELVAINHKSDGLRYKTHLGEDLCKRSWTNEETVFEKAFNGHSGEIHEIVYRHALNAGIEIKLGKKVVDYLETETGAGIVTADGERYAGGREIDWEEDCSRTRG